MNEKLLPCPFCEGDGDIAEGVTFGFSRQYQPCCRSCGITGDIFDTYEKAIIFWNRRAQPENKPLTCEGCESQGKYENEEEYGYPSPCTRCARRAIDNYRYKPEEGRL